MRTVSALTSAMLLAGTAQAQLLGADGAGGLGGAGGGAASAAGSASGSLSGVANGVSGGASGTTQAAGDIAGGSAINGESATLPARAVAAAFAWLSEEGVAVVNASLVGPDNRALEAIVRAVLARGVTVVAAAGNDGPSAPPLYPAGYPGVIAVTAVDSRGRALPEAARGEHIDFAAPGADMVAAGLDNGYYAVRGTSFAAPIVAGLIALARREGGEEAFAVLAASAEDLGRKGRDKVYGEGLVGAALRVSPAVFAEAR